MTFIHGHHESQRRPTRFVGSALLLFAAGLPTSLACAPVPPSGASGTAGSLSTGAPSMTAGTGGASTSPGAGAGGAATASPSLSLPSGSGAGSGGMAPSTPGSMPTAGAGDQVGGSQTGGGQGGAAPSVTMGGQNGGGQTATDGGAASSLGGGAMNGGGAMTGGGSGGDAGGSAGAQSVELSETTIWIAGDSTVANGSTPCPVGWGREFEVLFNDYVTVVNRAIGGRSVRTWLYNVLTTMGPDDECELQTGPDGDPTIQDHWQAMLDGMQAGDYLLIQFGINDGSVTCNRHVGLEAFKTSYGMMAEAAKERGAQPLFLTPVSAVACDGATAIGTRGGYVTATHEAGAAFDVPVLDLHERSVALYDSLGFCPIPGGDVSDTTGGPVGEFFCIDHTHFDAPGAVQIAELVANALRDQGIGLADYLE